MMLSRSEGGLYAWIVVGVWWSSGAITWTAVHAWCSGVVGAGRARAFGLSSMSVSSGRSGMEYWVRRVSTGMLFHYRTYVLLQYEKYQVSPNGFICMKIFCYCIIMNL